MTFLSVMLVWSVANSLIDIVIVSLSPCLHVSDLPSSEVRLLPVIVSVELMQSGSVVCISATITPVIPESSCTSGLLALPLLTVISPGIRNIGLAQMMVSSA